MTDQENAQVNQAAQAKTDGQAAEQQFVIQRIYVKDISFEAPGSPAVFTDQDWQPELNMDIGTQTNVLADNVHEVVLKITVTVKHKEKVAFLAEVQQAGIFAISGFEAADLHHTLGSFCPSVLYPYAREVVSDVVNRGGFPQLILAPVNFEALYAQHLEQAQEQATNSADTEQTTQ